MSVYLFLSSDIPLENVDYTGSELLSIEEAEQRSIPMPDWYSEDMLLINRTDKILIYAPDDSCFDEIQIWGKDDSAFVKKYSDKNYHAGLQWVYSDERAGQLIEYIKEHLNNASEIELWKVWLDPDCEAGPVKKKCSLDSLAVSDIKEFDEINVINVDLPQLLIDAGYKVQGCPYCLIVEATH